MLIKDVVEIKGGFVRAVRIDDFLIEELNKWKLESYLVNPSARETFYSISKGLHPTSKDRAHIISGTYGSGKSHFGLVLANYLTKNSTSSDLRILFTQIKEKDPNIESEIKNIRNIDRPYLVVLIESIDPDGINHALLKNLRDAIILPERDRQRGGKEALKEEVLQTSYQSALNKIKEWEDKKKFIKEFQDLLEERETDIEILKHGLGESKEEAYTLFKELHQEITLAHFEPLYGYEDVYQVYEKINKTLINKYGYRGIVIIWDQFNEHIEQRSISSLLGDVSILRHFAEEIERSGEYQIHLILISHNLPHTYMIERITKGSLDNWMTTERRFKEHPLTAIGEAEELIGYAITKLKDKEEWEQIEKYIEKSTSTKLVDVIKELELYPQKDRKWIIDTICKGTYPLHPITTYCLPMISDVVGQEAGTMFTFFEGTLEGGLTRFTNETQIFTSHGKLNLYTVDFLFDFFRKAIEESPKTTNLIRNFNDAINNKVKDPKDILTQRVLKSLVVIKTIQSKYSIPPLATASTLSVILEVKEPKLNLLLESLVKSDVLWRRENGEYEFRAGEVIFDFSCDFREMKEKVILDSPILELRKYYPPEPVIAKGYEEEYKVARRLDIDYVNVDGLKSLRNYENVIKSQYKDGILLYVIIEAQEDIIEAKRKALNIKNPQLLIAIPKNSLNIYDPLKNIKALEEVGKRPAYQQEEAHNIWLDKYNSEKSKLDNEIGNLKDVSNLDWLLEGNQLDVTGMKESEIADYTMFKVFYKTPVVLHRKMANKSEVDQCANRKELNTLILGKKGKIEYPAKGRPAGKTILEQTFEPQGMLKRKREGDFDHYEIIEPINENMKEVWNLMKKFLMGFGTYSKFDELVKTLQLPPYGLSLRVIELFIAAFLGMFKDYFKIKTKKKKYAQWEQETFTGDTIYKIVNEPTKALIEYIELPDLFLEYILVIDDILPIKKKWDEKLSDIENAGRLFVEWFNKLPLVTKSSSDLSPKSKKLVNELKDIKLDSDMRELLVERLPNALGMQNIISWGKRALEDFEKEFKEIVTELNDYPSKVEKEVMDVFKEVFEIEGEMAFAVTGKLGNWYYKLDPSVKQTPPSQDAAKLMECIRTQSDFRQGFLIDLPKKIGISEYTKWTDIPYKLKEYSNWLKKTKKEIDTKQKKIATSLKQESPKAHSLKRSLKERIEFARKDLEKEEIITILEELLEEYRG